MRACITATYKCGAIYAQSEPSSEFIWMPVYIILAANTVLVQVSVCETVHLHTRAPMNMNMHEDECISVPASEFLEAPDCLAV